MSLPSDYLERVYAGVLGKLIGVYLGRPFEGWTYAKIMEKLGPIDYYVHERLGQHLVVTDDDVAGTFTFLRALEDYGTSPDLSSEDIGKAWLNYLIEHRSILWWGGNGNSTEHTAWLNLKRGITAPASGSIDVNGETVAEQIGAQIFIDGWALVAPGQPELAARLARAAGRVSHDGESVHAAALWAAMEAEAFVSSDIEHLIDVGLSVVPKDCLIARLIADIRRWHAENPDWLTTRQLIQDTYGYDKFPGNCHVVPNHALMIMAILYAPHDFQAAQRIVNTAGWDTDCNAGNVGCLSGLMLGLDGIEAGPDWRGPVADRLLISSADGGNGINDAVRIAYYVANLGRKLAGEAPLPSPKDGARFHFSLPGSVQGFRPDDARQTANPALHVGNTFFERGRVLEIAYTALAPGQVAAATTPTFAPPGVTEMRTYELMATPTVYPGQTVRARVIAPRDNAGAVDVRLTLKVFGEKDRLRDVDGQTTTLTPGGETVLEWRLPEFDGQPIGEVGIAITTAAKRADGRVLIDWLRWDGAPEVTLRRPKAESDFWRMAWVNGVSFFSKLFPPSFRISQAVGEGMVSHGTREWTDYAVKTDLTVHLGAYGGLAVRVQGLRRYYGIRLVRDGRLQIVKVRDETVAVLAETPFDFAFEKPVPLEVRVRGNSLSVVAGGVSLEASDNSDTALTDGGIGLVIHEGALSTDSVTVSAV